MGTPLSRVANEEELVVEGLLGAVVAVLELSAVLLEVERVGQTLQDTVGKAGVPHVLQPRRLQLIHNHLLLLRRLYKCKNLGTGNE